MATATESNTPASKGAVAPVGWFEIGTPDPDRAERFYGSLFGWTFERDPNAPMDYRIISAGVGPGGGIANTGGQMPNYAVFIVEVADVAAVCVQAAAEGGSVTVEPVTADTGLVFAHITDPDGNHFGVFSPPTA